MARSIPANQCIYVFAFGVGAAGDAGKIVTGYITDSGGVNPPPSINNLTVFLPGTIFKTSQGGTIGFVEVCNPTTEAKDAADRMEADRLGQGMSRAAAGPVGLSCRGGAC